MYNVKYVQLSFESLPTQWYAQWNSTQVMRFLILSFKIALKTSCALFSFVQIRFLFASRGCKHDITHDRLWAQEQELTDPTVLEIYWHFISIEGDMPQNPRIFVIRIWNNSSFRQFGWIIEYPATSFTCHCIRKQLLKWRMIIAVNFPI